MRLRVPCSGILQAHGSLLARLSYRLASNFRHNTITGYPILVEFQASVEFGSVAVMQEQRSATGSAAIRFTLVNG